MKQIVSFLNRWGGQLLSVLLLSVLFVGCHEPFDDTDILNRLDNLEERIEKLEKDYQDQVKAMQALTALQEAVDLLKEQVGKIDAAKITENAQKIQELLQIVGNSDITLEEIEDILAGLGEYATDAELAAALAKLGATIVGYDYDEATGKVSIMLSNGETFEFLTGDNAVDAVKVKKDTDGNSYWAVGDEFLKDANGNNIPVSVTPKVKVDADTREVSISVDNGATWHATGIVIAEEVVVPPSLFAAVESDDDYVYFTLADGTKLTVALSSGATDVVFELNKLYVDYGTTETVQIGMENVAKYVIVKPEGWRVSVNEVKDADAPEVRAAVLDGKTVLKVTAPAEGEGEESGLVSFFCVGADGRAAIYEMEVVAGLPAINLAIDSHEGTFDITIDDATATYVYGVAELKGDVTLESVYEAAVAELSKDDIHTGNLEGISFAGELGLEAAELGSEYVAWAVLVDGDNDAYKAKAFDQVASVTYQKMIDITLSDATSVDAKLKIETVAGSGNYLYYIQSLGFDGTDPENKQHLTDEVASQINSATSTSDVLVDGKYDGSLLELYREYMDSETKTLNPGETIFVAVVPENNKIADAVVYGLVTLDGYKYDSESTITVAYSSVKEEYTQVKVRATPTPNTMGMWCVSMLKDYYDENYGEGLEEDLMNYILKEGKQKTSSYYKYMDCSVTSPVMGKDYIAAFYVFDPATAKGKVFVKELSCPAIQYNEEMSLSLTVNYTGVNYAEVAIVPEGGEISSIRYGFMKKADFENNATLKGDMKTAEIELVKNLTVSNRRTINTANLSSDNVYRLEELYLNEENQYIFIIAYDKNNKVVHMQNVVVNTKAAFDTNFDENLTTPTINEVYYISSSTGYNQTLDKWNKMSDVTDVTTLDGASGMYYLEFDTNDAQTIKHMWLCNEDESYWETGQTYALTGDKKADAITVIKKRISNSPKFYAPNVSTGVIGIPTAALQNTSEYKTLRDKTVEPIEPKTLHLVWETTDGKYGYMTVVPEDYASKDPGTEEPDPDQPGDTPAAGDLANSPWGHRWVWQEDGMQAAFTYMMIDLGVTTPNTVILSMGSPVDEDMEAFAFMKQATYTFSAAPELVTSGADTYLMFENSFEDEYRLYFSGLEWYDPSDKTQGADAVIKLPTTGAYDGFGIEAEKQMKTYEAVGLPPFTYVEGGPGIM